MLTGAPIDATNLEVSAVSVETTSDEDITVGDKFSKINEDKYDMEELNTEAYQETLNIDIENINKIEKYQHT